MLKKLIADIKGTSVVEFALLAPVFFAMVFGIIDLGRAFWVLSSMEYAVEAAGRYLMINNGATNSQITTQAQNNLYGINTSTVNFGVSSTSNSGINYKIITATSTFNFVPGGRLVHTSVNLSKQVEVPLVNR